MDFCTKWGLDDILRRCVLDHEREQIMHEAHYGPARGHFQADTVGLMVADHPQRLQKLC